MCLCVYIFYIIIEQNSIEFLNIGPFNSYWAEHNDYQLSTLGRIWISRHLYFFSVSVCVSFSPSLSVRVERGCALGALLQCRQTPDSPIHYYSLCVCLQGSVSSTGDWGGSPPLHTCTDTHSELIDPIPLSRKTFPLRPASTSTHPPPPHSWLNAYYLPLSPPLHFPYWYPSFSFYLYSSSSSFSSHSASFPPLCFPHYSYLSRAS